MEKPAAPTVTEATANGIDVNGEAADDEGDEWQASARTLRIHSVRINKVDFNLQLIGTRNKGTVTRATHFGRTPVSDIFRGELRSRLQREGDHSTDVMQPFFTLQLNIEV